MSRGREPDGPETTAPPPRANPELLGHEAAEAALRRLFEQDRLPHALLLTGPRGIGKATLAFRLARFVLAHSSGEIGAGLFEAAAGEGLFIPPDIGVFRRVASGGHADLLTIERTYNQRLGRLRNEILVDNVREIANFLHLTSAEGGWRVAIVDGAEAMNASSENAVLKILEEPPGRALLLLVSHRPGRLLPTIRSRCRKLRLSPLAPELMRQLLARYRPDLDAQHAEAIAALAEGSIGRALDLASAGGVELYRSVLDLLSRDSGIDATALHAFADRLARREADESYRAVGELIGQLLARLALAAARPFDPSSPSAEDTAVLRRLGGRAPAARWAELRAEIGQSFTRTDDLNLDRKQTILGAFFAIERAGG
ncbi:MAG TPA: DNA polymerase III subunit delta' [Stellaceae bacterium]